VGDRPGRQRQTPRRQRRPPGGRQGARRWGRAGLPWLPRPPRGT